MIRGIWLWPRVPSKLAGGAVRAKRAHYFVGERSLCGVHERNGRERPAGGSPPRVFRCPACEKERPKGTGKKP